MAELQGSATSPVRTRGIGRVMAVLVACLLAAIVVSLCVGRYTISVGDVFKNLASPLTGDADAAISNVLFTIRVPRVIVAMLIGAALACAGAVLQTVFQNPMVSPDLLGASAGAGFGAVLAMYLSAGMLVTQLSAFAGGIVAVLLAYGVATKVARGSDSIMPLVLTGIMVGTLFQAFISIVKLVADTQSQLPAITFWLMGGLSTASRSDVLFLAVPVLAGLVVMLALRHRVTVLAFGRDEASTMGVNVERLRLVCIACATLVTSSSVAVGGLIGWVGLIIPHIARMLVGANCSRMLPVATVLGAIFMLVVDDFARCLFPNEIPIGILTAILGAPFFVYLLYKRKGGWR